MVQQFATGMELSTLLYIGQCSIASTMGEICKLFNGFFSADIFTFQWPSQGSICGCSIPLLLVDRASQNSNYHTTCCNKLNAQLCWYLTKLQ